MLQTKVEFLLEDDRGMEIQTSDLAVLAKVLKDTAATIGISVKHGSAEVINAI